VARLLVAGIEVTALSDLSCRQARRQRGFGIIEREDKGKREENGWNFGTSSEERQWRI